MAKIIELDEPSIVKLLIGLPDYFKETPILHFLKVTYPIQTDLAQLISNLLEWKHANFLLRIV